MSVRDQERKERELIRRINEVEKQADRRVGQRILHQQQQADLRADEVERRIEKGDVQPRELPGKKEDSVNSTGSVESAESAPSMESS